MVSDGAAIRFSSGSRTAGPSGEATADMKGFRGIGAGARRPNSSALRKGPCANGSLAKGGCQILIAAIHSVVEFNILEFYRGRHTYVGIDTLAFSSIESANVLRTVMPGFASGFLRPFPIAASSIYPLSDAKAAYATVIGSSRDRIVLRPKA
jgi:hypothetical protein